MKDYVIGVWCAAGSKLLAEVHGRQLLRLVFKRIDHPLYALVPWTADLDHLEAEIKGWSRGVRRCWPEERIAMRDLVVETGASIGLLVQGDCGVIDKAEVSLALARVSEPGVERYESPRVRCYKRSVWLSINDTEEWAAPCSVEELRKLLGPSELEERMAKVLARRNLNT